MQTSIVFLSAKSKEIGIGHFSRICKIAEACDRHFSVYSTLWLLSGNGEKTSFFHETVDDEKVEHILNHQNHPDFVVFDLHSSFIDDHFKKALQHFRATGIKVIGVDCSLELCALVDIIWIPSFFIKPELRPNLPSNVIFGWDTYLNQPRPYQEKWIPGSRILVLTGGSDVAKQGQILPRLLEDKIGGSMIIDWVQGPYSEDPLLPGHSKHTWNIHKAPVGISHLIKMANYAITLYGVSLFELLSYGVPTAVYSPYEGRDDNEIKELAAENICLVSQDALDAVQNISRIIKNHEKARELSESGSSKLAQSGLEKFVKMVHLMKRSTNDKV